MRINKRLWPLEVFSSRTIAHQQADSSTLSFALEGPYASTSGPSHSEPLVRELLSIEDLALPFLRAPRLVFRSLHDLPSTLNPFSKLSPTPWTSRDYLKIDGCTNPGSSANRYVFSPRSAEELSGRRDWKLLVTISKCKSKLYADTSPQYPGQYPRRVRVARGTQGIYGLAALLENNSRRAEEEADDGAAGNYGFNHPVLHILLRRTLGLAECHASNARRRGVWRTCARVSSNYR
ncbi:hypothetical protein KM043_003680 [Ampulex compressa]|nr:hypothetical protein KM043_003680 [Ampulex compressa]